jgi:demethylmenaquinone methyltransferase/2-methoxy-6-polyprenyl-1,4-benzoquinol methylase
MKFPSGPRRRPDASVSADKYRRRAAHYDLELAPFEPMRARAIEVLDPHLGDTVLDIGCGTGLSFDPLLRRIGPSGRIVGVEPSPDMLARARDRVVQHGWSGVALLEATADAAPLQGRADAALFHFTHDVLREPAALDHVFEHLKPGAPVAACGLQWAPPWMLPTNLFVLGAALYSVSSLEGLEQPWTMLAQRLQSFEVRSYPWFGLYLASGRVG